MKGNCGILLMVLGDFCGFFFRKDGQQNDNTYFAFYNCIISYIFINILHSSPSGFFGKVKSDRILSLVVINAVD
ncbi:hypothetical protein B5D77_12020 [Microcystis sp. MC19]|nr:hypothetical protein B5D77_12020 [Microcystis sp. MC19]